MPDEPSLTQPLTYAEVAKHPTVLELHTQEPIEQGLVDRAYVRSLSERILLEYEREFARAKEYQPAPEDWLASNWQGYAISSLCQTRPYKQNRNPPRPRLKSVIQIGFDIRTRLLLTQ